MKTKKKTVIKKVKKTLNYKSILVTLALILGISGYLVYKNYAQNPEIFVVRGDGLEAEEAGYIKKATVKTGAPAPVVKVTVEKPDGTQYTSNVSLKKSEKEEKEDTDKDGKTNTSLDFAAQITNKVLKDNGQAPLTYQGGVVVDVPANPAGAGSTTTPSGGGTCSTAGSPVLEGTWVSTGHVFEIGGVADSTQRECVKCGAAGKYEDSKSCSVVFQQGFPMVLPSGGGQVYTGKDIVLKPCFTKLNGGFVQVGAGYSADGAVCTPDGNMTKATEAKGLMDKYCSNIKSGQVFKDGKCQASTPAVTVGGQNELVENQLCSKNGSEVKSDNLTWLYCDEKGKPPVEIKCSVTAGLELDAEGKCRETKLSAAEEAAKKAADAAAAAKALATKELALAQVKKSYVGKSDCDKALLGTSTLECYPTGPIGSQTYAIRAKSSTSITYISCPMLDENAKDKMVDAKKGCGSDPGTVAAAAVKNLKYPEGTLTGGETTTKVSDCRFGASPLIEDGKKLSGKSICNDYTGRVPSVTADPVMLDSEEDKATLKIGDKCVDTLWGSSCKNLCPDGNFSNSLGGTRCGSPEEIKDAGYIQTEGMEAVANTLDPTKPFNKIGNTFVTLWGQLGNLFNIQPSVDVAVEVANTTYDVSASAAPIPKPNRVSKPTSPGTLKDYEECFIPADCESGFCNPSVGNVVAFKCTNPSNTAKSNTVDLDGKFKNTTPCYSNDQCGTGLYCDKSFFFDTCKPLE